MQPLEVAIAAILGIAQPVIRQRHDLARRIGLAHGEIGIVVCARPVFVEIIAEMERAVELVRFRCMGIGVEPAEAHVRTREHRHAEARRRPNGQCPGASFVGLRSVGRSEAIIIPFARFEPGHLRLAAEIAVRRSRDASFGNHAAVRIGLHHSPAQLRILSGDKARPQQDPVRPRLAAGDAMGETALGGQLGGKRRRQRACREDAPFQDMATVERGKQGGSGRFGGEHDGDLLDGGAWTCYVTGSRPLCRDTQTHAATRTRAIMTSTLDKAERGT